MNFLPDDLPFGVAASAFAVATGIYWMKDGSDRAFSKDGIWSLIGQWFLFLVTFSYQYREGGPYAGYWAIPTGLFGFFAGGSIGRSLYSSFFAGRAKSTTDTPEQSAESSDAVSVEPVETDTIPKPTKNPLTPWIIGGAILLSFMAVRYLQLDPGRAEYASQRAREGAERVAAASVAGDWETVASSAISFDDKPNNPTQVRSGAEYLAQQARDVDVHFDDSYAQREAARRLYSRVGVRAN